MLTGATAMQVASSRTLPNEPEISSVIIAALLIHHGRIGGAFSVGGSSQNRSIKSNRIGVHMKLIEFDRCIPFVREDK